VRTTAYTYDPFGAPRQAQPVNKTIEAWTGRWDKKLDTITNLIEMGARPYDPASGRFLEVDPVEGGSLNQYDYAGQDQVNGYDLTGKYNGCGPGNSLTMRILTKYLINPVLSYGAGIAAACRAHDACYGNFYIGASKTKCDNAFLGAFASTCKSAWVVATGRSALCFGLRSLTAAALRSSSGDAAWFHAQREACYRQRRRRRSWCNAQVAVNYYEEDLG